MTMARTLKLYKLPDKPKTPGIRLLEKKDIPQVCHAHMLMLLDVAPELGLLTSSHA